MIQPREDSTTFTALRLTHFHVKVSDLPATLVWFDRMCGVKPAFQNAKLAYLALGSVTLVLEPGPVDTAITIAFGTPDCDRDFEALVARGAVPIAPPTTQPWGIRGAYFAGPAGIIFELEQRVEVAIATASAAVAL